MEAENNKKESAKIEQNYVEEIVNLVRSEDSEDLLKKELENYHENDIADAFVAMTTQERLKLSGILGTETMSEVFTYLDDASSYMQELGLEKAAEIISNMDSDDAVDLLEDMEEETQKKLVDLVDEEAGRDIRLIQSYEDDEIGSIMTTNFIQVCKNMTIKQVMRELVSQAEDNDNIETIYVSNEDGTYYGALDLKDLIVARDYVDFTSLVTESYPYVRDHDSIEENLDRIRDYAENSIPVLGEDDHVLGVITAQDIIEVVDEALGEDYARLAGLTAEEDLNETLFQSMRKRLPWLCALLILGIGISSVVGIFENVVSEIALLVAFQSLILDMAGNVGTQSLAVTIRVLVDEQLTGAQKIRLVFKEMKVGVSNGLLLGSATFVAIGLYVWLIKHNPVPFSFAISGCVAIALLVAMLFSSVVGTVVPLFFHRIKMDPAVASGPLITTINDLIAILTYYGVAWLLLIKIWQFVP